MTYALCGFANFGSLGIMIGGMSTMCPQRRGEIVALGLKSIVAGTLAHLPHGGDGGAGDLWCERIPHGLIPPKRPHSALHMLAELELRLRFAP